MIRRVTLWTRRDLLCQALPKHRDRFVRLYLIVATPPLFHKLRMLDE